MSLSDYQEIRDMVSKFADSEVAPLAHDIDHNQQIPASLISKLAENGFLGSYIPEEFGGAGMDYTSYSLIVEEISRACASTGVLVSAHTSLCVWPVLAFGTEEQKKKYLPKLASGELIGCFCLSEPNAGSDAGSLTTFAEDKGDHYEITGMKNWITNGREAGLAIVFAKTTKTPNYKGISAFIVETASEGFNVIKIEDKLGIKGSSTAQIALDKIKVPKENLLGGYEKGFRVAMATLDGGRIGIASQALGIAEAAFRYARQYVTERVQFGAPLANLQGIQFILADMSTKIAASRLLIYEASRLKDLDENYTKASAQAKLFAAEAAMWIATKAVQLCGGNGYTKEYPVERYFRDAKITEIYEGTSEVQRIVIAAQELKEVK
ncbi:butyryl-CoA dehydrogenase [Bacteriovorax sp. BSW11_IV]|uniref:acyl-CoA dehydrogenase family protein n=1 Tax=Bacteriovorax sp. BSW11_IV TaxID=1353529 RepID=UPI00038A1F82|nr:acyl-CoA dehydrogenase family protein [Bacteriovorax sp. BSW11_IV]EQC48204.1 butyryl-CoA dehydrogenase [Bacteriovorax sp. BSW11_IV]